MFEFMTAAGGFAVMAVIAASGYFAATAPRTLVRVRNR